MSRPGEVFVVPIRTESALVLRPAVLVEKVYLHLCFRSLMLELRSVNLISI